MLKQIYFNEFNLMMGNNTYLPLVSGLLHAYVKQSEIVTQNYPDCTIIFGGCQVPHLSYDYMKQHDFIDITVRGEGENSFLEILEALATNQCLSDIAGVTSRNQSGEIIRCDTERNSSKDLDLYPSPYLEGMFDELITNNPHLKFQAIIETNRGCPFKCTFCYWGMGGLSRKYRFHSIERVQSEIEWIAKNQIEYVFNADSNFGMHRRDSEIAQILIDIKKKTGFPEKFRTCYGKNTDERIFDIGSSLHNNQLEKGITISYQSVDPQVQKNIKRANIKLEYAEELQRKFNELEVPVYTELILGLPGENMTSLMKGIDHILNSGLKNQLFLYICEVLPNTDMADPGYQKLHGIRSRAIELTEIHVSPRETGWVTEYEDIVIETNSMSQDEWKRMLCFSWTTMLFHSLKAAFYILAFLRKEYSFNYSIIISCFSDGRFDAVKYPLLNTLHHSMIKKSEAILNGEGRGIIAQQYGNIYWEQEELMFFQITESLEQFYTEFYQLICEELTKNSVEFDANIIQMVFDFQELSMPTAHLTTNNTKTFDYNLPEYFETLFTTREVILSKQKQNACFIPIVFNSAQPRFARETVLMKRKNGNFLNQLKWQDCLASEYA